MNVIHGTGTPKIYIKTKMLDYVLTVHSTTVNSITVSGTLPAGLQGVDNTWGLINRIISGMTIKNNVNTETNGKILSFDNATNTITVDLWSQGQPTLNSQINISDFQIDLPYCQELAEWFTPDFVERKLRNGNIDILKKGFYYNASLDYSKYATKELVESLRGLYRADTKDFTFYPRKDNPNVKYIVDIVGDKDFQFAQLTYHQAHKYVKIYLRGTRRLSEANLQTPATDGYGDDFGGNDAYGYGQVY